MCVCVWLVHLNRGLVNFPFLQIFRSPNYIAALFPLMPIPIHFNCCFFSRNVFDVCNLPICVRCALVFGVWRWLSNNFARQTHEIVWLVAVDNSAHSHTISPQRNKRRKNLTQQPRKSKRKIKHKTNKKPN